MAGFSGAPAEVERAQGGRGAQRQWRHARLGREEGVLAVV